MKRIYTRRGDDGTTGIFGGERVNKDDARIEANGCVDELNTSIGQVRSLLPEEDDRHPLLRRIQLELMAAMSLVATPSHRRGENPNRLDLTLVADMEKTMDDLNAEMTDNGYFILPGGTSVAAQLHAARVAARRAERRLCTLNRIDPLPAELLQMINRLSDLFFVMARYELHRQGWNEERWNKFGYKKQQRQ
ncbi:MAG: cob(I)yrinic acid a,c-diamide adenosyltransferase [Bacteroides sp.]|nr:cob(I)yrinic acid a,c-diamide adenosyltransferase [Bacteroides sp.]